MEIAFILISIWWTRVAPVELNLFLPYRIFQWSMLEETWCGLFPEGNSTSHYLFLFSFICLFLVVVKNKEEPVQGSFDFILS